MKNIFLLAFLSCITTTIYANLAIVSKNYETGLAIVKANETNLSNTNTKFLSTAFPVVNSHESSKIISTGNEDLRPKFRIGFEAPKIDHRQILLTLDKRATTGVDWGFDALMYQVFSDDMYWVIENKKYVIQAMDTLLFEQEIPLGVQTLTGGAITIKIDKLENVSEEMAIFLKDKKTNTLYNLRKNNYTATLPAGIYHNSYSLVFKMKKNTPIPDENALLVTEDIDAVFTNANEVLVVDDIESTNESEILYPNIAMYLDHANASITIKNPKLINVNTVILYTMLGQKVQSWETDINTQYLSMSSIPKSGVYVLHAHTENGQVIKKIMIE